MRWPSNCSKECGNYRQLIRIGRCHALAGNLAGYYAMDLAHPYRLLFEKANRDEIHIVKVIAIEDYH